MRPPLSGIINHDQNDNFLSFISYNHAKRRGEEEWEETGTVTILDKPPVRKEITKLEVVMKQSAEASSKWNTIGTVVKREPGVWGRISPESVTKNILTELNLLKG